MFSFTHTLFRASISIKSLNFYQTILNAEDYTLFYLFSQRKVTMSIRYTPLKPPPPQTFSKP